jgi:hypothetical protein
MKPARIECSLGSCFALQGSEVLGGVGPQTAGGDEIVGERMPERMSLGFDQTANWKKAEAMVLAVGVDPLPPRLEAGGSFSRLRMRRARLA